MMNMIKINHSCITIGKRIYIDKYLNKEGFKLFYYGGIFYTNLGTILALTLPFFSLWLLPLSLIFCYYGIYTIAVDVNHGKNKKLIGIKVIKNPLKIKFL